MSNICIRSIARTRIRGHNRNSGGGGVNGTRIRRASAVNGTTKQVCFYRPQPNVDLVAWLSGCGSQTAPRVPRQPDDQTTRALVAWSSVCLVAGAQRPEKITHSQTTRRPDNQGAGHPVGWLREPKRLPTARRPDDLATMALVVRSAGCGSPATRRVSQQPDDQTRRPSPPLPGGPVVGLWEPGNGRSRTE